MKVLNKKEQREYILAHAADHEIHVITTAGKAIEYGLISDEEIERYARELNFYNEFYDLLSQMDLSSIQKLLQAAILLKDKREGEQHTDPIFYKLFTKEATPFYYRETWLLLHSDKKVEELRVEYTKFLIRMLLPEGLILMVEFAKVALKHPELTAVELNDYLRSLILK